MAVTTMNLCYFGPRTSTMEEDPTMQRAWGYHWRRVVAWSALSALVAMTGLTLAALGAGRGGE